MGLNPMWHSEEECSEFLRNRRKPQAVESTPPRRGLEVDVHEFGLIVAGLRKLRGKLARDLRRSAEAGFVPAPGRVDLAKVKAKTLADLMDRLGITEKGERR